MSTRAPDPSKGDALELPVAELLRSARPLPPHDEMALEDLTPEEGEAFLAVLDT